MGRCWEGGEACPVASVQDASKAPTTEIFYRMKMAKQKKKKEQGDGEGAEGAAAEGAAAAEADKKKKSLKEKGPAKAEEDNRREAAGSRDQRWLMNKKMEAQKAAQRKELLSAQAQQHDLQGSIKDLKQALCSSVPRQPSAILSRPVRRDRTSTKSGSGARCSPRRCARARPRRRRAWRRLTSCARCSRRAAATRGAASARRDCR